MIRISAKRTEGFRRCGQFFTAARTEFPDDRFSAAELAVLAAEPMLRVEKLPEAAPEFAAEPEIIKRGRRR
jgi:hypothetical protein